MVQAYNFLASWQLFPEKGSYEKSQRPKSGTYRIEATETKKELSILKDFSICLVKLFLLFESI